MGTASALICGGIRASVIKRLGPPGVISPVQCRIAHDPGDPHVSITCRSIAAQKIRC